jgi:hypothetical protein
MFDLPIIQQIQQQQKKVDKQVFVPLKKATASQGTSLMPGKKLF